MSSLLSSNGSLSMPSGESLSLLIKVPFDDLTSLMYICHQLELSDSLTLPPCSQISACSRDRTLESKYAFLSPGTVLLLVCLPILI
jgi:hypothetical protein